ncbi:MAG: hypothetical protein GY702_16070 [Desulfobulbaceae bacterium]|nr:hypothetical protein [Desulfobulbaceae bacterium]
MPKFYLSCAVVFSFMMISTSHHVFAEEGFGISVKGGTLGVGAELSTTLSDNFRLRGGLNYLTYSFDTEISDIDYEFEPEFNSISLLLDYHPFGGSFFLSGGAFLNNNNVPVSGSMGKDKVPSAYSQYNSATDLVNISGDVEFQPVAPYLGLGWRSKKGEKGWGFACDLGVMFQGAPEVNDLRINAPVDVNGLPEVQEFLKEQEQEIEDELERFQYYPVASIMFLYNF